MIWNRIWCLHRTAKIGIGCQMRECVSDPGRDPGWRRRAAKPCRPLPRSAGSARTRPARPGARGDPSRQGEQNAARPHPEIPRMRSFPVLPVPGSLRPPCHRARCVWICPAAARQSPCAASRTVHRRDGRQANTEPHWRAGRHTGIFCTTVYRNTYPLSDMSPRRSTA